MLKLFLIFLKINFLTTSGPASIGLTKQLTVPDMIDEGKFSQILAITSGIPGSDAMQMAWQIGYVVKGIVGAIVSIVGALIPTLFLLSIVYFSMNFIDQKALSKFFAGVNPALAVLLVITAFGLMKSYNNVNCIILLLVILLFYIKTPVIVVLLLSGILGVFLL